MQIHHSSAPNFKVFQNKSIKVTQLAQDKEDANVWPNNEFSERLTRTNEVNLDIHRSESKNLSNKKRTIPNPSCENDIKL